MVVVVVVVVVVYIYIQTHGDSSTAITCLAFRLGNNVRALWLPRGADKEHVLKL